MQAVKTYQGRFAPFQPGKRTGNGPEGAEAR